MIGISYWAWFGTFSLLLLSWQDLRHNMKIDDRRNYFMLGATAALLSHVTRPWWYVLALLGIVVACLFWIQKVKVWGDGDHTAFLWMFLGYSYLSPAMTLLWIAWLSFLTIVYVGASRLVKGPRVIPYYPVFLASFFLNCLVWKLYVPSPA